jgi:hypothetical protein
LWPVDQKRGAELAGHGERSFQKRRSDLPAAYPGGSKGDRHADPAFDFFESESIMGVEPELFLLRSCEVNPRIFGPEFFFQSGFALIREGC